jgi:hypothetical protein
MPAFYSIEAAMHSKEALACGDTKNRQNTGFSSRESLEYRYFSLDNAWPLGAKWRHTG